MQQAALNQRHEETREAREKAGAVDVLPGRIEGMRADEATGSEPTRSRAQEKRKRELEERKKLLEARKRKKTGKEDEPIKETLSASSTKGDVPLPAHAASDPFAMLEAGVSTPNAADAFLAQVEQEMLKR